MKGPKFILSHPTWSGITGLVTILMFIFILYSFFSAGNDNNKPSLKPGNSSQEKPIIGTIYTVVGSHKNSGGTDIPDESTKEVINLKSSPSKAPVALEADSYIENGMINLSTIERGTKITINSIDARSIRFPFYLIDDDLNTTIRLNATMLRNFSYTLTFNKPIKLSKIGFYQPEKFDPGEYLRTVEIRAKSSSSQNWESHSKFKLNEDSGETLLSLKYEFPVAELYINPLDNVNGYGFTQLV